MIMRWISEVPSKIVKIVDYRAVFAGQRPAGAVVSARIQHGLSEMSYNDFALGIPASLATALAGHARRLLGGWGSATSPITGSHPMTG
jgi:hypothetical protein